MIVVGTLDYDLLLLVLLRRLTHDCSRNAQLELIATISAIFFIQVHLKEINRQSK